MSEKMPDKIMSPRQIMDKLYGKGFCYGDGQCNNDTIQVKAVDQALTELQRWMESEKQGTKKINCDEDIFKRDAWNGCIDHLREEATK